MTRTMLINDLWCRLTIITGRHKLSQLIVELHLSCSSFAFPSSESSSKFSSFTASSMLIVLSHVKLALVLSFHHNTEDCDSKHLISRLAFSTILSCPLCLPACVLSRGSCLVWAAAACLTHGRLRQQLRRGTNSNAAAAVSRLQLQPHSPTDSSSAFKRLAIGQNFDQSTQQFTLNPVLQNTCMPSSFSNWFIENCPSSQRRAAACHQLSEWGRVQRSNRHHRLFGELSSAHRLSGRLSGFKNHLQPGAHLELHLSLFLLRTAVIFQCSRRRKCFKSSWKLYICQGRVSSQTSKKIGFHDGSQLTRKAGTHGRWHIIRSRAAAW